MKDWYKVTYGDVRPMDIVDTDEGTTHLVRSIILNKSDGQVILELKEHRPLKAPPSTEIEVYR